MERLPALHYQLIGEFQTLLGFPLCASYISCTNLLEVMAINMFAIDHTSSQGNSPLGLCLMIDYPVVSTPPPPPPPPSPLKKPYKVV